MLRYHGMTWSEAWTEASWRLKVQAEQRRCVCCSSLIAYAGGEAHFCSGLCELCDARRRMPPRDCGDPVASPKAFRARRAIRAG